ncbi:methyltransferase domain-containing protein [Streptomyces sp. DSM 44915]|uniref:Methyltransferase domain-containing protein n=1 Tax=Streptomyces chisholmiae TaxID=3075540 RepID=A0ABU2JSS5_9ACTN|nr:methyltransferase domain-containing protein [Streptomyces sp. DSM 44915]MDT0267801.1 methyltransferase domain-containing protein [Streptomyces sp. DSM 44915]
MTRVAAPEDSPPDPTEAFAALLTEPGQRLLDLVRDVAPAEELAVATRLRRDHPAGLVAAALGQARLRQRAVAKFGAEAGAMYFTPDGLEQATRTSVAAWRAGRLAAAGARRVADLCCGVGGDAIALARAGLDVLAVDRSPLTCAVARANASALGLADRIKVRLGSVEDVGLAGYDTVFVDPARRGGRGRVFDPEAYSPPLSWALATAADRPLAALKIAPGVPHEAIPAAAEAEWVSHRGEVKEAVLWFGGDAAPGRRRATLLPAGDSLAGTPEPAPTGAPGRYLYEPDGAVIRAGLVGAVATELAGRLLDPSIAYVTTDQPRRTPFAVGYELTDVLPFHLKRLRALLRERDVGTLTVKKRGSAISPEELLRRVKPSGTGSATVFLTRVAGAPSMLIGHPLAG